MCYLALPPGKCTCGAISAKKLGTTFQPLQAPPPRSLPPPLPSSSTSVPPPPPPPPPVSTPPIADGEDRAAAPPVVVETTANKPRELRHGREEETMDGESESAPKRRKITPSPPTCSSPVSGPSLTPPSTAAPPRPASDVVPTLKVAEIVQVVATQAEETVVAVRADKDSASAAVSLPNHPPDKSATGPESDSTLSKPKPVQDQGPDPSAVAATGDDDVISAPRKIGIQHIQLVYETVGKTLQCRMCLYVALHLFHIA